MAPDSTSQSLQTLERAMRILEALQELDGARVTVLADRLDMSTSSVHRYLSTLAEHGYVAKNGDEYRVGLRLFTMGEYARNQQETYHVAKPMVDQLADETNERVQFVVEEHGRVIYMYRSHGAHAIETNSRVGARRYMHTLAGGKAILAQLPQRRVEAILDRWGLPAKTEYTITDREELYEELERVRDRGVAFNKKERIKAVHAVAAPVLGSSGMVRGAIAVSGPSHRLNDEKLEEEIPDLLRGTIEELELKLRYS